MYTSFPSNIFIVPDSSLGRVWGFGVNGPRFKPRWSSFLSILWVFRFHNFMSKMSQESQVNLNFADYDKLGLRLSAISISPQSEERQVWPVGCPRAGCKIGRCQKWQRRLILKNQTVCILKWMLRNWIYICNWALIFRQKLIISAQSVVTAVKVAEA